MSTHEEEPKHAYIDSKMVIVVVCGNCEEKFEEPVSLHSAYLGGCWLACPFCDCELQLEEYE